MAANRARQRPPRIRGKSYPEAINRKLVFFGVTYTPVFANIAMEIPPFLDVFSIGKKVDLKISIAMAMFYWYGYIKSKKKTEKKSQNRTPQVGGLVL